MAVPGCFFPYSRLFFTDKPEEPQEDGKIHEHEIIGNIQNLQFYIAGGHEPTGPGQGIKHQLEE